MEFSTINDDAFAAFAEAEDRKADSRNNRGAWQSNQNWTGMETGIPKIVRVIGGPPNSNLNNYTSRVVTKCRIIDDNGKQMEVWKPALADSDYILNRIINRITKPTWIKDPNGGPSKKIFPVQEEFPEIYNIIEKNGLEPGNPQYNFDKGWKGTEVLIMNVIDRSKMDWHRENKHTLLLAKSIVEGRDGNEYIDKGVSSFAVMSRLSHLFKAYGSWEKYDIAFVKTGRKDNPYTVINASHSAAEVDSAYQSLISMEPSLTEEEKSWKAYDLEKEFKYTSATKIYTRLQNTIRKIDRVLGTEYLEELKEEVEREKAQAANDMLATPTYSSASDVAENIENSVFTEEVEEVKSKVVARGVIKERKTFDVMPPHLDVLTDEEISHIVDIKRDPKNNNPDFYDIKYDYPNQGEMLSFCPVCGTYAPQTSKGCPGCGVMFE